MTPCLAAPRAVPLTQALKAEAHRLGFQWVGITTPEPPEHFQVFEDWLAAGRHGEMAYLATERSLQRRSDPRQILPECQSILVLGLPYSAAPSASEEPVNPFAGKVAAYAWGDDYHNMLPEKLQAIVSFISAEVGKPIPNRWYTDTGPLLERDLAQRAGLGWIGKNTCLIHPRLGSYFLLAEILLGIPLEPDAPFTADRCGACTRCLEACPTGCILPDRTLDARRCISYLTIELKGSIPVELRPLLGSWVFGCDVCQQVCPWNQRFASQLPDPAFAPLPGRQQPDLLESLALDAGAFYQRWRGSPLKRAKRGGFLRNAAVALGNLASGSEDERAVQALSQALLEDPEALVRMHAAWALQRVGGQPAHNALQQAALGETDPAVLREIHAALGGEAPA